MTIDVEEWWHLDYLRGQLLSTRSSMLDGLERFLSIMNNASVRATLFVVGELARQAGPVLRAAQKAGHEIACHGWAHDRPLVLSVDQFRRDICRAKGTVEDVTGGPVHGYRAPCYSLDRPRLDEIRRAGFQYDSSRIAVSHHPLYGQLNMDGFAEVVPGIWSQADFVEFELTTARLLGRRNPISGGGYLRLFPWPLTRSLLRRHLGSGGFYVLYIHPFELSLLPVPATRGNMGLANWARFSVGRKGTAGKVVRLLELLRHHNYRLATLSELRRQVLEMPGTGAW